MGENPYYGLYAAIDHVGSATLLAGVQYHLVMSIDQSSNPDASLQFNCAQSQDGQTTDSTTYGSLATWSYSNSGAPFGPTSHTKLWSHSLRGIDANLPLSVPCDAAATPGSPRPVLRPEAWPPLR